jgi:hypothetical protein
MNCINSLLKKVTNNQIVINLLGANDIEYPEETSNELLTFLNRCLDVDVIQRADSDALLNVRRLTYCY